MLNRYKKLKENLSTHKAIQFFNVGRFSFSLLTGILLVKFGLSQSDFDSYELFFYYGSLFTFFWVQGLQKTFLVLYPKYTISKKKSFKGIFFIIVTLISVLSGILAYFLFELIGGGASLESRNSSLLPLMVFYIIFNTPSYFIHLIYLLEQKPKKIIQFGFWNFLIQALIILIPVGLGNSLFVSMVLLLIFSIIRLIFGGLLFLRDSNFEFKRSDLTKIIGVGLPFIFHALTGNIVEYVDGFLVETFFSKEDLFAIFRYGSKELPIISLIIAGLASSIIPIISVNKGKAFDEIKSKTRKLSHVFFPISIVFLFISEYLYVYFFNANFILASRIFNIYLLIVSSRMLLPQLLLSVSKYRYVLVLISIIETIINVILSIYLLNIYGILGIAYATVIASLMGKGIMVLYNKYKLNVSPSNYIPIKVIFIYSVVLYTAFIFKMFL